MFLDSAENEIAWRRQIKNISGKDISDDEFKNFVHGAMNEDIIRYFMGPDVADIKVKLFSEEKEIFYRELCLKNPKMLHLAPGLIPLLNELRTKNIPIASKELDPNSVDFNSASTIPSPNVIRYQDWKQVVNNTNPTQ